MKKLIIIIFALLLSLTACTTTPTITVTTIPPATESPSAAQSVLPSVMPSPTVISTVMPSSSPEVTSESTSYGMADLGKLGITEGQYEKIHELLTGILNIEGNDGNPVYIPDPNNLSTEDLLTFVYSYLYNFNNTNTDSIDKNFVVNLIRSAFDVSYQPKDGDDYQGVLTYDGANFAYTDDHSSTDGNTAYPYSLTLVSPDQILIKFDIVDEYNMGCEDYIGKGQAIIEKDNNSQFGYHLVSFAKLDNLPIQFASATASSSQPTKGSKTFAPMNAIDGKEGTVWGRLRN